MLPWRSRGVADECCQFFLELATDAYAELKFLSQLPFVDPNRIAVLGAADGRQFEKLFPYKFIAAIAYYPGCRDHSASLTAGTVIVIGEADDLNSAEACREMGGAARIPRGPPRSSRLPGRISRV